MLTIHADGTIGIGSTIQPAYIRGTSPRELVVPTFPSYTIFDVTHVWHSPDLPAIVESLLGGNSDRLPYGYHVRARRDGCAMIGVRLCRIEPVRCRQCHGVGRPNVAGRLLPGLCPACDGKGYIEQEHETEEQEAHL